MYDSSTCMTLARLKIREDYMSLNMISLKKEIVNFWIKLKEKSTKSKKKISKNPKYPQKNTKS